MPKYLSQPLYSVSEVLSLLKIGRTLFYREVAAGRIEIVKSGKRSLVKARSIKNWIDSLPTQPTSRQK